MKTIIKPFFYILTIVLIIIFFYYENSNRDKRNYYQLQKEHYINSIASDMATIQNYSIAELKYIYPELTINDNNIELINEYKDYNNTDKLLSCKIIYNTLIYDFYLPKCEFNSNFIDKKNNIFNRQVLYDIYNIKLDLPTLLNELVDDIALAAIEKNISITINSIYTQKFYLLRYSKLIENSSNHYLALTILDALSLDKDLIQKYNNIKITDIFDRAYINNNTGKLKLLIETSRYNCTVKIENVYITKKLDFLIGEEYKQWPALDIKTKCKEKLKY
jgi:hypothetical protein